MKQFSLIIAIIGVFNMAQAHQNRDVIIDVVSCYVETGCSAQASVTATDVATLILSDVSNNQDLILRLQEVSEGLLLAQTDDKVLNFKNISSLERELNSMIATHNKKIQSASRAYQIIGLTVGALGGVVLGTKSKTFGIAAVPLLASVGYLGGIIFDASVSEVELDQDIQFIKNQ